MAGITREYWLEYAKSNVTGSIESRVKAGERLDTFLSWVWSIYTGIFALGMMLQYLVCSPGRLIILAQPILVIMFARFFCVYVGMPGSSAADPNAVEEIIKAHVEITSKKMRRLKVAIIATVISILSICVALVGYNLMDPDLSLKRELTTLKLKKDRAELIKSLEDTTNPGKPANK